jgi:hypothetical protein
MDGIKDQATCSVLAGTFVKIPLLSVGTETRRTWRCIVSVQIDDIQGLITGVFNSIERRLMRY